MLPARYAATSGHARWGAALAAGAAAAQALLSDAAAVAMPSFEGAWALAPDQAAAAEAAAEALADWRARVRALDEAGRAAAAMQGGPPRQGPWLEPGGLMSMPVVLDVCAPHPEHACFFISSCGSPDRAAPLAVPPRGGARQGRARARAGRAPAALGELAGRRAEADLARAAALRALLVGAVRATAHGGAAAALRGAAARYAAGAADELAACAVRAHPTAPFVSRAVCLGMRGSSRGPGRAGMRCAARARVAQSAELG